MPATIPDEFLDAMAEKLRLFADPTRLSILRALSMRERSVSEVVEETGRGQANVSKHLKLLTNAGLVARRKEGLRVYYKLDDPLVGQLCDLLCATLVSEARAELSRTRRLLDTWSKTSRRDKSGRVKTR
ncbi:MAG: winged helix-turn-helix transcriptional regulator [Planctomycetota bacterium]|nr:winged helix-turn-helix transcriptional regulator [Planctomycetota bacterium]